SQWPARSSPAARPGRNARLDSRGGRSDNSGVFASREPVPNPGRGQPMPPGAQTTVGVPNAIKTPEPRVAVTPGGVEELTRTGGRVLIQAGAGQGSGISDEQYAQHGAEIVASAAEVWKRADLIVKVKEPLPVEWPHMRQGQAVFTYF